jgi:HEPN domain-containing protein
MCHLSIEKRLKGLIQIKTGTLPPRSHDLIHLSNLAGVKYDTDFGDFIGKLSNASVVTRYPADLEESLSSYPSDVAGQYLKKTEEVLKWLKAA